jgi:molybdopterin-synthase adenylyltransferase
MTPHSNVQIRIPANVGDELKEAVKPVGHRESIAFALVSHAQTGLGTIVLVRKIISLPAEAYMPTSSHGAKWRGAAMLPILNEALSANLGIVLFHIHQERGAVELSPDDRRSAQELLPIFQNLVPARPHGSVVFSTDHVAGLMLLPNGNGLHEEVRLRWVGKVIVDTPGRMPSGTEVRHPETYHRQMLLIGSKGQSLLKGATVGVVGLGGGGSHTVQQLAHAGAGKIIGVDHDRATESNRHRLIGIQRLDVLLRRRKTKIMARMVRRINRGVSFEGVPYALPDQRAIDALKEADLIIGCVDTLHARADLHNLAWRYLIPYVDIGLLIVPGAAGAHDIRIGGNVAAFIPGAFCAWCVGLLSQEKLDAETGGRPRSYLEGAEDQAQVVSFNGLLASQAVSEVLQLIIGFVPQDTEDSIKKFDGIEGTLTKWIVNRQASCGECRDVLAAGDLVWQSA